VVQDSAEITERAPGVARAPQASIGPRGRAVRLAGAAAAVALLLGGTVAGTNDWFPFGPFTMYAGHYAPNGVITSNSLMARTADGREVVVTESDTGLTRAELEGELFSFRKDPGRLASLARAFHLRHPGASPYVEMWIAQQRWQLHNRAVAAQSTVILARWHA
jgi:hypothetical protein